MRSGLTIILVGLVPSLANAQYLFQPVDPAYYTVGGTVATADGDELLPPQNLAVVQRRITTPDPTVLTNAALLGPGSLVPVNLFSDANIVVSFVSYDYISDPAMPGAVPIWLGDVVLPDEYPSGGTHPYKAWFALASGRLYGGVDFSDRHFQIVPYTDGTGRVMILEHAKPNPRPATCGGFEPLDPPPEVGAPLVGPFPDIQTSVKVAVILTKRMRTRVFWFGAVKVTFTYVPQVQSEIASMNLDFARPARLIRSA